MNKRVKCITITGPTASGKTALAVQLARRFNGEIIGVDSRQVYRKLDIGSGKDIDEYGEIKYHLIDIVDLNEEYNLLRFCQDATNAVKDIISRGKTPFLCGGTAMYLNALLNGFTLPGKELSHESKTREQQNPLAKASFTPEFEFDSLVIAPYYPRKEIHQRIEQRLDDRFAEGMIDEVKNLHDISLVPYEKLEWLGLEYREISKFLKGECSSLDMRNNLLFKIRQFAKRQDIFFRKLEREGMKIYWLEKANLLEANDLVTKFLNNESLPDVKIKISEIFYGRNK